MLKKGDIRQSLLAKVTAIFLLTILTIAAAVLGVGAVAYYETDLGQHPDFYKSEVCENMTWNAMNLAYNSYLHDGWYPQINDYSTNFGYEIYRLPPEDLPSDTAADPAGEQPPELSGDGGQLPESGGPGEQTIGLLCASNVPARFGYRAEETWGDIRVVGYVSDSIRVGDNYYFYSWLNDFLCEMRGSILATMGLLALLMGALVVFLVCAAGHRPGRSGITPNHLDKMPLDLYLALAFAGAALVVMVGDSFYWNRGLWGVCTLVVGGAVSYFIVLATLMTMATRLKLGKIWRNTITYRFLRWAIRLLRRMGRTVMDTVRLLPYAWRTVLAVAGLLLAQFFLTTCIWTALSLQGFWLLCLMALDGAVLMGSVHFVWQMHRIFRGGEALAEGDLEAKVTTDGMFWDFKRHAENLNAIGEGMNRAVEQRLQSERLKTELITNVSHDIKTPLTSIVNYVDLLKKEPLEATAAGYVEVLDRQSRRLKKLTEDLVEASKASTGNVAVDLQKTVVNEVIHQAVGEYAERLTEGKLEVVVNTMQGNVLAYADGRLLWRVLDNLLSNVSKYAMPGTRVYIDLKEEPERVRLTVKNISRDPLNIDASELTERFVRGDASRNTEGSGLGLNIAKSLIELMRGEFWLEVDGDLFKAAIALPRAWERNTLEAIAPPPPGFGDAGSGDARSFSCKT